MREVEGQQFLLLLKVFCNYSTPAPLWVFHSPSSIARNSVKFLSFYVMYNISYVLSCLNTVIEKKKQQQQQYFGETFHAYWNTNISLLIYYTCDVQ